MRTEDRPLIERVRLQGCILDQSLGVRSEDKCCEGCDVDHVTTQGSGGGDVAENLMPLCRKHHSEKGQIGYAGMINKYKSYHRWLIMMDRTDVIERARRSDPSIGFEVKSFG